LKKWDLPFVALLLIFEAAVSLLIVKKVPYTEIDWEAYMQEVTTWQDGERDYMQIRGGTGPLVYPAGFLYMYGFFKWLTDGGTNILSGQYLFCVLYVIHAAIVLSIYALVGRKVYEQLSTSEKSKVDPCHIIWSWRIAMAITCLSKRIHSIFVLRLFNDAPCMLLFYLSALLYAKSKWRAGCVFFSLAVSVKMNVLLFAPGLLLLLLQSSDGIGETIICLGICASIQVILAGPFLLTYPVSYVRKAFEFDRVFFYKWTVNWKFLSVDIFTSKALSVTLLSLHLTVLFLFAIKWIKSAKVGEGGQSFFLGKRKMKLNPIYVIHTLFVSNFIGIAFARTLHYQFYSWYFHSFPLMLWLTNLPLAVRICVVMMTEYAFNVFPATPMSSGIIQIAHFIALFALWFAPVPRLCDVANAEHIKTS